MGAKDGERNLQEGNLTLLTSFDAFNTFDKSKSEPDFKNKSKVRLTKFVFEIKR